MLTEIKSGRDSEDEEGTIVGMVSGLLGVVEGAGVE